MREWEGGRKGRSDDGRLGGSEDSEGYEGAREREERGSDGLGRSEGKKGGEEGGSEREKERGSR